MSFWDRLFGKDSAPAPVAGAALLTTVHSREELLGLEALLRAEEIPYRLVERGAGAPVKVIAGFSVYDTDVFVREDRLSDAQTLLQATVEAAEQEEVDE